MSAAIRRQGPLARRMDLIEVTELLRDDTAGVLRHLRSTLVDHDGVAIDAQWLRAVARSQNLAGLWPDKAITLLDVVAARAASLKQPTVTPCD